jgi:hypothetical protein
MRQNACMLAFCVQKVLLFVSIMYIMVLKRCDLTGGAGRANEIGSMGIITVSKWK